MGFFGRNKDKEKIEQVLAEVAGGYEELSKQAMAQMEAMTGGADFSGVIKEASAMGGAQLAAQVAYRDRMLKLTQKGLDGRATVRAARTVGSSILTDTDAEVDLTVTPPAGAPYEATAKQYMLPAAVQAFTAGLEVPVKIDPDNPQDVLIWGSPAPAAASSTATAPGAPAPASAESGRIERLEKLAELRQAGGITEEEFQRQKAEILASS